MLTLGQAHWVEAMMDAAKRDLLSLDFGEGLITPFIIRRLDGACDSDGHNKRLFWEMGV